MREAFHDTMMQTYTAVDNTKTVRNAVLTAQSTDGNENSIFLWNRQTQGKTIFILLRGLCLKTAFSIVFEPLLPTEP